MAQTWSSAGALSGSLAKRATEEIGHAKCRRVSQKVLPIEPGALHSDDAEDIPPLPVGRFSAGTIPAKFLQQDVFGWVHGDRPGNGQGIDGGSHGGSRAAMSGYAFRARSAPSVTMASRRNASRGDASG